MYFGKRKYSQLQEFTHFVPSNHLISHGFDSGKRVDSWSCDSFKESRSESESQKWGITATPVKLLTLVKLSISITVYAAVRQPDILA